MLAACAVALIATGQLADLLFAAVLVVNSGIGIVQEVRAKRALDRLALLAAPRARVLRDDAERVVPVDDVVVGDAIVVRPGDQVVADGRLLEARGLQVDESILTGESDPDARRAGDERAVRLVLRRRAAASTRPSASAPTRTPTSSPDSRARIGASSRRCSSRSTGCCA